MAKGFSGSKAASVTAAVLFILVVVAIVLIVGGDELIWSLRGAVAQFSRSSQGTFLPTIWEYKFHILVFGAVIGVLFFIRKMHDGPVKKA
jgi:hypothetical protein